jgi:molybdate transport system substrate-binding protein
MAWLTKRWHLSVGVTAIASLMATRGIDVIGPIPSEIQSYVVFGGAVGAQAVVPDVARELIAFVTGPAALPVIRAKGMEPG